MTFIEYVNKRDAELNELVGGLTGQALGATAGSLFGPIGTVGGALAGRWAGNKFDKWVKGTKEKSDQIDPSQKGWVNKSKDWVRNKYLAADSWAERHPNLSSLASLGLGAAGAYGVHNSMQPDFSAPDTGDTNTATDANSSTATAHVDVDRIITSDTGKDLLDKIREMKPNIDHVDSHGNVFMKDGGMQDWGEYLHSKLKLLGHPNGISNQEYFALKQELMR